MAEIKFLRPLAKALEKVLPQRWVRRYELFLYSAGISFLALEFLLVSLAVFLGIAYVYPYYLLSKKIEDMEKNLPDAFFYLASSLRAGVSFSEALEEASTARFGALTEEFKRTVQEIKKGRSTIEALKAFAIRNKRSSIIYRSTMIILEAYERGAPMADVLVAVANDVREILRIKKERKASTGMQAMFFIIASGNTGHSFRLGDWNNKRREVLRRLQIQRNAGYTWRDNIPCGYQGSDIRLHVILALPFLYPLFPLQILLFSLPMGG
ncbi:MAG: hypothetical protein PWP19_1584 [Thermococcaceae archaeon]|nr:hypothetical protein [Thermococcaceae archaeon]